MWSRRPPAPLAFAPALLSLALSVTPLACSGSSDDGGGAEAPKPAYARDGELRMNHVQSKGTHNSYHVETPGSTESDWHYSMPTLTTQLAEQGVRQVELDVHLDPGMEQLEVFHLPFVDAKTTCQKFTDCLSELKAWSDARPGHQPLYVQIEVKSGFSPADPEAFFARLEGEIGSVWPADRLITPDRVKGSSPTLREALASRGWPTLGEARGKAFFAIDNHEALRTAYTRGMASLDGRLLFIDSGPQDPFAAVAIINDPVGSAADIKAAVGANLLVRTMARTAGDAPPSQAEIDAALASGAHFISTDFPAPDAPPPLLVIPSGTPSRCNPLSAPAGCTPGDIEDPAKLK